MVSSERKQVGEAGVGADRHREKVVVVGNGMVGQRFCERLRELDTEGRFSITVLSEEPRPAYDRVHLSDFFAGQSADDLALVTADWFEANDVDLRLGAEVAAIEARHRAIRLQSCEAFAYDKLVLATGSAPFVPPIPGTDLPGVFVYRTIDDLEAIRDWGTKSKRAAVIGGGLLGLEAARALREMGLETHVVEFAERLMPRQVDARGGELLRDAIEDLGVSVWLDRSTRCIRGDEAVEALEFEGAADLEVDMVVISAGIRPRDELARAAELSVGERGGICVDDELATSDPHIFAIGECALHEGSIYGLVAPGYDMAETLARRFVGEERSFSGADLSTKLKLLGVEVASFGDPFADRGDDPAAQEIVFEDSLRGVYQKLIVDRDRDCLLGGMLIGDADAYGTLLDATRRALPLPPRLESWLFAHLASDAGTADSFDDAAQVCSCNDVTAGAVRNAIAEQEIVSLDGIKKCTRAGTGCGGCVPALQKILGEELERTGASASSGLCEHFEQTRAELFWIVKVEKIRSFDALLDGHGTGDGCEVCRPVVASILAATWNEPILEHSAIQDTNDRFLANIQRGGTYSVVPRVPGGEITPEKLIVLGEVAKKYDLYCKITGGQRVDLLGARVEQLPAIWRELVEAGFESGHAYGKAMRTVKSCVGSTWCRYGVQDSTGMAIRIEERYRGLRAPHKLKSAVSGCIRECAEAQNKDFGVIATDKGWNLYLGGNGGANPRHADLFATDLDDDELIRLIDRYLMFYIRTAKPLQRTARWLEELEGGLDELRRILIDDALDLCETLEAEMQQLVDGYRCEWREVVENPVRREEFRHFVESRLPDRDLRFVEERGQKRPADWEEEVAAATRTDTPAEEEGRWVRVALTNDVPPDGGRAVDYAGFQIALFHFARRDEWFASQNMCPHRRDMVLARGLLGSEADEPKVACPMHKKTFSLRTGKGLSDPAFGIRTFPVEIRGNEVWVKLPRASALLDVPACSGGCA